MQYFKCIIYLKLIYEVYPQSKDKIKAKVPVDQLLFRLVKYVDNNYVSDSKNKKLVMEHYFFVYGTIFSLYNIKQKIISISTTEVKYIALKHTICEKV